MSSDKRAKMLLPREMPLDERGGEVEREEADENELWEREEEGGEGVEVVVTLRLPLGGLPTLLWPLGGEVREAEFFLLRGCEGTTGELLAPRSFLPLGKL